MKTINVLRGLGMTQCVSPYVGYYAYLTGTNQLRNKIRSRLDNEVFHVVLLDMIRKYTPKIFKIQ